MLPRPDLFLAVGDVELRIDLDLGARATSWRVAGLSLLAQHGTDPVEHGMYPMAPWAGRLRGNRARVDGREYEFPASYGTWALHGTALRQAAEVVEHVSEPNLARLVARVSDHPGWPWPMDVDITWELRERRLRTCIEVVPRENPVPAVVGWHPWFHRQLAAGGALEWSLQATQMVERGADYLPTGVLQPYDPAAGPFDDAFVVPSGRAQIRWPGALRLDIVNDAGWYVVFDQLSATACIEPQSGPPDGLNAVIGPVSQATPVDGHRMVTDWLMVDDLPEEPA